MAKKRMKKKQAVWKNSYFLLAGIILVAMIPMVLMSDYHPFTTIANQPEDFVLDARIKIVVGDDEFVWNIREQFPDALKERGLNGTVSVFVMIDDTSVDILSVSLKIEGPINDAHDLVEGTSGIWLYEYDTTMFIDGTYVFTLEGEIDTSPLYRTDEGGIETFKYDTFNVVWKDGSGTPEYIKGIPNEYLIIGGIVVVLLLFTGNKKKNQSQVIVMQPSSGYTGY